MRAILFTFSLLSVVLGPWWVVLVVAALVSLRYRANEMLILGMIADILWLPHMLFWGLPLMTIGTVCIHWFLEPLRRELFVSTR